MSLAKYGFITTKVVKIESKISEPQPIPVVKIEAKDVSSVAEQSQDIGRERLSEKKEDPKEPLKTTKIKKRYGRFKSSWMLEKQIPQIAALREYKAEDP